MPTFFLPVRSILFEGKSKTNIVERKNKAKQFLKSQFYFFENCHGSANTTGTWVELQKEFFETCQVKQTLAKNNFQIWPTMTKYYKILISLVSNLAKVMFGRNFRHFGHMRQFTMWQLYFHFWGRALFLGGILSFLLQKS